MPADWFLNRDVTPLTALELMLAPCEPEVHGSFIRTLTRENFYDMMSRTIGWNESIHQQEPRFPERYKMVQTSSETIGFFSTRSTDDYLYLETIQLLAAWRGRGYGTALLQHIEKVALSKGFSKIRLRVFEENRAQSLYQRVGYIPLLVDEYSLMLMEKIL